MSPENKGNQFVEFKNGIKASYQKSSERAKFFNIFQNNLKAIVFNGMMSRKDRNKIVKPQVCIIFMRLAELFVYFVYNILVNHFSPVSPFSDSLV